MTLIHAAWRQDFPLWSTCLFCFVLNFICNAYLSGCVLSLCTKWHFTAAFEDRCSGEPVGANNDGAHVECISVLALKLQYKLLEKDKMNKKRHFLEPPEVKDYLLKGERFTKWSEVSVLFKKLMQPWDLIFHSLLSIKVILIRSDEEGWNC